jgi:sulfite reductase (ferredoxin)
MEDAYYFCLGGAVGQNHAIARPVGYRCAAVDVPDAIERLLLAYLAERRSNENLRQFFARHSTDELRSFLAGQQVEAVTRDAAPGPVPHGLEG